LGPDINSSGKELFPEILRMDNQGSFLIFSSNGRFGGKGGLDLFYTAFPLNHNSIYPFEFPFNSVHDDFSMAVSEKKGYGFFSSNRENSGNDDIYYFTFDKKGNAQRAFNKKSREVVVISNKSHYPIPDVIVQSSDRKVFYSDSLGKVALPRDYPKNSTYSVQAFGYEPISNISLDKDTIALSIQYDHPLVVKNIWYELDKSEVVPENAKELDRIAGFLKTNPDCQAHLKVHTYEMGSDQYNLNLSQSRASAAAVYISSKIKDSSRIKGEGSGNKFPIYKPLPGKPLSIQQHRQNRRIEVIFALMKKSEDSYSAPMVQTPKEKLEIKEELFLSRVQFPYYLVLGSFSDQQQALDYLKKTRSAGLKSTAFLLNKNYRVGIGYNSMEIAKKSLEYFKNKYKNCWILQLKR
jgi:outer membrane protein OmpA-like peptidoglycan-associated protein